MISSTADSQSVNQGKRKSADLTRVHLIGVGGAGMSAIARILLARGSQVSGSDAKNSNTVLALNAQGARISVGHQKENFNQFDDQPTAVVVSTAIRADNPELRSAQEQGIPVMHRAEALAVLTQGYRLAAVTGAHGKTSTSSMLTVALQHCRLDPSFAIGGELAQTGGNAHHGTGEIFVIEADESDGSFLAFAPRVALVTNIEADHLDQHGSVAAYVSSFHNFVDHIVADGTLVVCVDSPEAANLVGLAQNRGLRVREYGYAATGSDNARFINYQPQANGGVMSIELNGETLSVMVSVPGEHMAGNAVGALLAALELGADRDQVLTGLAAFTGVRRRFELKGEAAGVRVYDDYAHHPTEVSALLAAARQVVGDGKLIVIFQPHLYSRTRLFAEEFGQALSAADQLIVMDVFAAREDPELGVTGALITQYAQLSPQNIHYEPSFDRVPSLAASLAKPGDIVITTGAGDVTMLGPEIIRELAT